MFESIVNPKRMDKGPLKMLFIGLIYATLSLGSVKFAFSGDPVLSQYSGIIVVTFCVMFSLPFMYFLIKQEEEEDEVVEGFFKVWKMHSDAVYSFMFLFLGFVLAFSFWYIIIGDSTLFNAFHFNILFNFWCWCNIYFSMECKCNCCCCWNIYKL